MDAVIAWMQLAVGLIGNGICMVLWLRDRISDRAMIGLTLTLSWAALWFSGITSLLEAS